MATDVASVEHNISNQQSDTSQNHPPRLPDLSTFFSALEQIDTSNVSNSNAVPTPVSVAAPFRMLADALGILSRELDNGSDLLEQMRQQLMGDAEMPPREVQGVGQEFLDGELISPRRNVCRYKSHPKPCAELDRVPKKSLQPADNCPICNNPFLEGKQMPYSRGDRGL